MGTFLLPTDYKALSIPVCLQVVFISALQLMVNMHIISALLAQQNPT